jgi:magnesium transporter
VPLVDNGLYVAGHRIADPPSLSETFETMRAHHALAWIGLYRPTPDEIQAVADEFGLHPLAIEDALSGHQRSKIERYGDTSFVVLRPARYLDAEEEVEVGELDVFVGPDFVVTIRHAESPDLGLVRKRMETTPDLLAKGPNAVLYAILDQVVDEYEPVLSGVENDIDEIEDQLFGSSDDEALARRIYFLSREVMVLQRAMQPLAGMLAQASRGLESEGADVELQRSLRDVMDHVVRGVERVDGFRAVLDNALTVHTALVGKRQNEVALAQNEQMKKVSSWAAILFTPTLVGGIYGMNFEHMPELTWQLGYPFALGLMLATGLALYVVFKRKQWI